MKRIALILLFSVYSIFSFSQLNDLVGKWTNGFVEYHSSIYNDSIVIFEVADLHEGGYAFSVILKQNEMFIFGRHPEYMEYPSAGEVGDKVIFSVIQGKKNIVIKNSNGKIVDFFVVMKNKSLKELRVLNKINHELAGIYQDKSGKKITFKSFDNIVNGLLENQNHYSFGYEFDTPSDVIVIDEKAFYYVLTENGMDIYKAEQNQYDSWVKKDKLYSLEKIEWLNLSDNDNLTGKYQFASTQLLVDNVLSKYTVNQLKIMRNEIFARHGYVFKTTEMNEYFSKQDWYKPVGGNIGEKMNEIEKLNVQLIKRYEEK